MIDKISIALCTYNGESFLPAQLESFRRQTRLPDELIVCDDRSTDKTVEILEKFAAAAPFPVRIYVNEKNLGTIKNFEKAITLCGGDLIFLSDQDDFWLPPKIARFAAEFERRAKVLMIFSNAELTDENLAPLGTNLWDFSFPLHRQIKGQPAEIFKMMLAGNVVTGATMAFRSTLREFFLPIPTDLPLTIHDAWIALIAAANGEVDFLDETLIKYRQHDRQQIGISQVKNPSDLKDYESSISEHGLNLERLSKLKNLIKNHTAFDKKRDFAAFIESLIKAENEVVRHYKMRAAIGKQKSKRILPIFREIFSGRYHRFSKGLGSAAKDLLRK